MFSFLCILRIHFFYSYINKLADESIRRAFHQRKGYIKNFPDYEASFSRLNTINIFDWNFKDKIVCI